MEPDADFDWLTFVPLAALVQGAWNPIERRWNQEEEAGTPEQRRERHKSVVVASRVPVRVLVTLIEKHGIYTSDRYGRYVRAEDQNVESKTSARHPLAELARYLELTDRPISLLSYEEQHELFNLLEHESSSLQLFGWGEQHVPSLVNATGPDGESRIVAASEGGPVGPRRGGDSKETAEQRRARLLKRRDDLKAQRVKDYAQRTAREEGISPTRLRQILSTKRSSEPLRTADHPFGSPRNSKR